MTRTIFTRLVSVILVCSILLLGMSVTSVLASDDEGTNDSIVATNEYSEDSIIVVLDPAYGSVNEEWNVNDFSSIDATGIEDLTEVDEAHLDVFAGDQDFRQILKIDLSGTSSASVEEAILALENDPRVLSVSPNYYRELHFSPNDQVYNDVATNMKNIYQLIGAESAWDIAAGSHNVTVGVVDTGIYDHEDLTENVTEGYDYYFDETITTDDVVGHGTHVAGIIGAVGNNTIGVTGVAPAVTMIPLQVNAYGTMVDSVAIIRAVQYATMNDIDIINCSFGGLLPSDGEYIAFQQYNGLVVCSAGNTRMPAEIYPAAYDLDNIISVAASTVNDQIAWFSNYGAQYVDLAAPGQYIYSTVPNGYEYPDDSSEPIHPVTVPTNYASMSGTSMAAPFVSGAAALLLSHNPNLSAIELKSIILGSVDKVPALEGKVATGGRLNVYQALQNTLKGDQLHTISTKAMISSTVPATYIRFRLTYNPDLYIPQFIAINEAIIQYTMYDHNRDTGEILFMYSPFVATLLTDDLVKIDFKARHSLELDSNDFTWEIIEMFDASGDDIDSGVDWIPQTVLLGDINMDGDITTIDVRALQNHLAGSGTPLSELQQFAADVNRDDVLDSQDTRKLFQYINGMIDSFV